ncbi:hypothetical protein V5O48_017018 [Marasmius crinis-equi]|uniref:Uncharacterized protein n=1 Tax=Marasmius crinis-equi TaxID=585013 RepID=A0ABR3EQD2_9AGAR
MEDVDQLMHLSSHVTGSNKVCTNCAGSETESEKGDDSPLGAHSSYDNSDIDDTADISTDDNTSSDESTTSQDEGIMERVWQWQEERIQREQEDVHVLGMLGIRNLPHQPPAGSGLPLDINGVRYIREIDANRHLSDIQYDYGQKMRTLRHQNKLCQDQIVRLRQQVEMWNRLAITVAEGVHRDMDRWSSALNDAILEGIDNVQLPECEEEILA